jgi:hypothetical protein
MVLKSRATCARPPIQQRLRPYDVHIERQMRIALAGENMMDRCQMQDRIGAMHCHDPAHCLTIADVRIDGNDPVSRCRQRHAYIAIVDHDLRDAQPL